MKSFVIIIFSLLSVAYCKNNLPDFADKKVSNQKPWNVKMDINFSETLPNQEKTVKADVQIKYEVNINVTGAERNTTKEDAEAAIKSLPVDYIVQNFMKSVNKNLLEDNSKPDNFSIISNNNILPNTNLESGLHQDVMNNNNNSSESDYYDEAIHFDSELVHKMFEKAMLERLNKSKEIQIEIELANAISKNEDKRVEDNETDGLVSMILKSDKKPDDLQLPCEGYRGRYCEKYLNGASVYVPWFTSPETLESKIVTAMRYSMFISSYCKQFALHYLCYLTFPPCTLFNEINLYNARMDLMHKYNLTDDNDDYIDKDFEDLSLEEKTAFAKDIVPLYSRSNVSKKICKSSCEKMEAACKTELIFLKNNPSIGQEYNFESCRELPNFDCIQIY